MDVESTMTPVIVVFRLGSAGAAPGTTVSQAISVVVSLTEICIPVKCE